MAAPVNARGLAIFGAGTLLRAVLTLLNRAFALLHPEVDAPLAFFELRRKSGVWATTHALRVEERDHPDFVRVLVAVPLSALQLVVGDSPSWRVLVAAGRTGRRLSREDGPLGFGQVDENA